MGYGNRFQDLTGRQFGRLVVMEFAGIAKSGNACWKCLCDCGKQTIVRASNLKSKTTKSCGCFRHDLNSKPKGESAFNGIYLQYKNSARRRNYEFNLNKIEFRQLISTDCYYCGTKPTQIADYKKGNGTYIYNGVDRLDNTKGYIVGNCVPCCGECNRMKWNLSYANFVSHIMKIIQYVGGANK